MLTGNIRDTIERGLSDFLANWAAHGKGLTAMYEIKYNHFIEVEVNEDGVMASGCSIDSLTRYMQEIDKEFDLMLFDRQKVAFL
ncbi:MAG: hypothetical protein M3Q97_00045, partial [Bacteroidota bacterium]|nr:hypothetical protein [Bacteroidota bacterium]